MKCAQATIAVPYSNSTRRGGGGGGSEDVADSIFGDRDKSIFIATKQPSESLYMEQRTICVAICVKFTQPVSIQLDCPNQIFILKPNFEIVLFPVSA